MKVLVRVDASPEIGYGHLSRCANLARAFRRRGHEVKLLTASSPAETSAFVEDLPCLHTDGDNEFAVDLKDYATWARRPLGKDLAITNRALVTMGANLVVVDHYAWGPELTAQLDCPRVMVIDDMLGRPLHADVVLDHNLSADESRYRSLNRQADALYLCGLRFALLGENFAAARTQGLRIRTPVESVVVFFGAGDLTGETLKVAKALVAHGTDLRVDVVLPARHATYGEVQTWAQRHGQMTVHAAVRDMAQLYQGADFVFGACGVSSWERACLGKACAVVTVADNQAAIAARLHEEGVCLWLGDGQRSTASDWEQVITGPMRDGAQLAAWRTKSATLTNGQGADEVVRRLEETA